MITNDFMATKEHLYIDEKKNVLFINQSLFVKLECSCGLLQYSLFTLSQQCADQKMTGKNNSNPDNTVVKLE
jgi:hypothetical protein